ncbi:hypothetical protein I352_04719 [Cryptococcus deuterogattii MMRL2647]|nr:hypothetical protein I352_04719 [Cryptococcus deuterogattii MMRL2647]
MWEKLEDRSSRPPDPSALADITKEETLALFKDHKEELKLELDKHWKSTKGNQECSFYTGDSRATIHWPSPRPAFVLAANFVPIPRVLDDRDAPDGFGLIKSIGDLNSLRRPQLRQWYEYYHDEVPEGGQLGDWCEEEVELLDADRETIDYLYPIFESTEIVDSPH